MVSEAHDTGRILVLTRYFLPGFKGGGPIQSVAGLTGRLGSEFDFRLITSDRDLHDASPYPDIPVDTWFRRDGALVRYNSPDALKWRRLWGCVRDVNASVIYVNSLFSFRFSILPILLGRLRLLGNCTFILAPRGELSPGALRFRSLKKRLFHYAARLTRLHLAVIWHASTEMEKAEIQRAFGRSATCVVARNLTQSGSVSIQRHRSKEPDRLRIIFLSRVAPKKNLLGAIAILGEVRGDIELRIAGPLEDGEYWRRCEAAIGRLPKNVRAHYIGEVAHSQVLDVLSANDLFLFPTYGENFGHVIAEALAAGTPVLTSDQTPWRDLRSRGVGWSLPLARKDRFVAAIQEMVAIDGVEFAEMSSKAQAFAREVTDDPEAVQQTRALLLKALAVAQRERA